MTTNHFTDGYPRIFHIDDKFTAKYSNTRNNEGSFTGDSVKITLNPALSSLSFTSKLAKDYYKMTTDKFDAVQYHFHSKSEHTIDDE